MSRPMKEGDIVDAHYVEQVIRQVEILSMPAATGDMLYLKEESGTIHAINTACSSFEGLVKEPTP